MTEEEEDISLIAPTSHFAQVRDNMYMSIIILNTSICVNVVLYYYN